MTFSIVARSPDGGSRGVAVASDLAVGAVVPGAIDALVLGRLRAATS